MLGLKVGGLGFSGCSGRSIQGLAVSWGVGFQALLVSPETPVSGALTLNPKSTDGGPGGAVTI